MPPSCATQVAASSGRGPMARRSTPTVAEVTGTARIDRRTKDLVKRLEPGDIAVINHRDLDRVAAEGLVGAGVAAVVNAGESISGRYPNGGPIRVVQRSEERRGGQQSRA